MKIQSGYQILSRIVYSITNTLTGCTNSNSATQINWGSSYSANITASSGYTLTGATVSITMGGIDVTSTAYDNGAISIAKVTGALVISVTAVDGAVPLVTITPTSQTTFSWSATDNVGVTEYAINTTGATPTSWNSGSSGTYTVSASGTVYVFAKDAQGNIGSSSVNVYSVSNSLTNCSSNNSDLVALAGYGYTATISASSGYALDTASVTMGGVDITSTAYSNGTVTIASVSGNIAITVSAVQGQTTKVLGVSWTNDTSTTMTRTDGATNMSYSINTNTGEITSDFSSEFPYNQMTRETDVLGNVFVNIPSMWFRVTTDENNKITGVAVSENQGSGTGWYHTRAFKYGAYGASTDGTVLKSVSGATRAVNITRATARTQATANGTGYYQRDLYAGTILMFLWWIEFATKNSQSIMTGYIGSATTSTGGTDNLGFSNGYNPTDGQMIWHGIEDFYGNTFEWEDGITGNGSKGGVQYVSNDYTLYNDTGTGMNTLAFNSPTTSGNNLIAIGWDSSNPFLAQPIETSSDSNYTTGFCDYASTSNNICSGRGSYRNGDVNNGVSYFYRYLVAYTNSRIGCRLLKTV